MHSSVPLLPLLNLIVSFFFHKSLQQSPISPNSIKWQNVEQCPNSNNSLSFFNAISMQCEQCPVGMESSGKLNECKCANGRKWRSGEGGKTTGECIQCGKDLAVSTDELHCVKCLASDGSTLGADPKTGKCPKCANRNGEIGQLEWTKMSNSNNSQMVEKCVECPEGTAPNWAEDRCERCRGAECICKKDNSSSFCAPPSPEAHLILLFENDNDLSSFSSEYLKGNLRQAEIECREGSRRQCEHLANLCALQDYAKQAGGACAALESVRNAATQSTSPLIVPQLFYTNIEASVEIFRDNAIDTVFELFEPKNQMDFVTMLFSMNGTLLGQQSIRLGFLQLCTTTNSDPASAFQFGSFVRQKCHLRLADFYDSKELWTKNKEVETLFFDLYIRYTDTNGEIILYPIPILNGDIRGDQYTGLFPNQLSELRRESRVLLTKRFYIFDVQRQPSNEGQSNGSNLLIRAANRIALHIHLQPFREGRIFIPYLQISHSQIVQQSSSDSSSSVVDGESTKVDFEFRIFYQADSYAYDKTIEVVMATACSISAVWAALRAYSWGRRSGKLIIDASTILKFVLYAAEGISNVFLFVIAITASWLIYAFKLQSHMFYVPLNEHQEGSFVAYLISATALKTLSLAHTLISLILVQTFFIDWERAKTGVERPTKVVEGIGESMQNGKADKNGQSVVMIWRTYLIANEWNELQLYRKTQLSMQLLSMLFLLDYLQFGNYAKIQSGFGRSDLPPEIIETRMSRFAVDVSFYFAVAIAQWLIQVIVVERVTDPFRNFMDLCSVANISVMAMTNPLRGLYIHGRSVHGYADTDMRQMNAFLQRERDNLCALRGLEMGSDLQTFVVNFPRAFRDRIDQITEMGGTVRQQQIGGGNAMDKMTLRIQQKARIYNEINEFLKDFVNRVDSQSDYVIMDSRLIEDLLGLELIDTSKVGTFRRDTSETEYSSAFLYGNEWVLMSFEMLFFCLVDLFWRNRTIAAFAVYLVSKCIGRLTKVYFTQQLANSSMVDNRFLI